MTDLSITQYNPNNMSQNYGYYPVLRGITEPTKVGCNSVPQMTSQPDKVTLSNKQPMSKQKKTLLALGGFLTAALGTVLAVKGYRSHQITKGLEQIEQKFLKLQENIPEVQSTFKDVFLRTDITEKEALEMLNRYKEVEKIGITGTKEEYIQAMFKEAKKNYGFDHLPSELRIVDTPIMGDERVLAFTSPLGGIDVRSTIKHSDIMDTIHHEFRHLKQRQYAFNLSPDEYVRFNQPNNMTIPKEAFEYALGGKANIANIPVQYMEFAEKSSKGILSYCSVKDSEAGYLAQWIEQDAYKTGQQIAKLLQK